ncbi:MAG TPA: phosphatase PAP2-related protein [Candidatus Paceibacterota bacterium]
MSLIFNFYAGSYATDSASNPVTDIVLNNIRTYDVDGIFIYGTMLFLGFLVLLSLLEPQRIPFIIKSIALFIAIRAVFVSLTHIGPFPTQLAINSSFLDKFSFGGDLFFSGHTGLPFLMALVFWEKLYLRILFIASSVFIGVVVLMAHLHYSIDVLAAFFITYTIFHIAERLFKKDRKLFYQGL